MANYYRIDGNKGLGLRGSSNASDEEDHPLSMTGERLAGTRGRLGLNSEGLFGYAPPVSAAPALDKGVEDGLSSADSGDSSPTSGESSTASGESSAASGDDRLGAINSGFDEGGFNHAPTARPDAVKAEENETVLVDVLANDFDVDEGAVLTVTGAFAREAQGTASIVKNQIEFDPGSDFEGLAEGERAEVPIGYEIADEQGATDRSTLTVFITGANDGPVANPDSARTGAKEAILIDVLANDIDVDAGAVLTIVSAAGPGKISIVDNKLLFDPGSHFDDLPRSEAAVAVLEYTIEDEFGVQSSATVEVTVVAGDPDTSGTDAGERLFGTRDGDWIDGLGGDDFVFGDDGDDVILAGDGNDLASGDGGNDVVDGGNDDDTLTGGDGNDELLGGAGNDLLFGEAGDDVLLGDTGDDHLDGGTGEDKLEGGDGDDLLYDFAGANSLSGGAGRDHIAAGSVNGAQLIDGGDGDDSIRVHFRHHSSSITTGEGRDVIELIQADRGKAAIVVTDFTSGAGGDMIGLSAEQGSLLSLLAGWDGTSNPFGSGFLRLQQGETGALLQWDRDGVGRKFGWETLMVFERTDAKAFTEANFGLGFHPDGSAPKGEKIAGADDDDILVGTLGGDMIEALGGSDSAVGAAGADLIFGGDGDDFLYGGADDDMLDGGNQTDTLWGGDGNDRLFGQADNDHLSGESGKDELSGGKGDDALDGGDGDDGLDGGEGDDSLYDFAGSNGLFGGIGHDHITAGSLDGAQRIDGGDGDDTIRHYFRHHSSTITTGSGRDVIELVQADGGKAAIVVTDFTPGSEGDTLRLSGESGSLLSLLVGWDDGSNPFGSGFLRLEQGETGTLLQWDRDGKGRRWTWENLVLFERTDAKAFIDINFAGYHPAGWAVVGQKIVGSGEDEILVGTAGDDSIEALGGSDSAFGLAGADLLSGGDGADFLYGAAGDDVLDGGKQDDTLWGGAGHDTLSGQAGDDILFGELGDDRVSGGDGNDSLDAGDGDDRLEGGAGQDSLSGGLGADVLSGGFDADIFNIQSSSSGADEITDFVSGADKILISAHGFGGGLVAGGPVSLVSGTNPSASNASGQFLYDSDDGRLLWDADGTGSGAAVLVATLSNVPLLQASDFIVG
jgi:Ca2+-binding RTX toxin-like protein